MVKIILLPLFILLIIYGRGQAIPDTANRSKISAEIKKGTDLWREKKLDSALLVLNAALAAAKAANDTLLTAKSLNNIGLVYYSKGEHLKSFFYYEQALATITASPYETEISIAYLNLGIAYKEQAIYDKALEYLFKSARIFEKTGDTIKLSSAYNTIGNIFMLEKSYDKALEYHRTALALRERVKYKEGIAASLNNIGIIYKKLEMPDSALRYFEASLSISNNEYKSQPEHVANTLSHIAEIYQQKKDYISAIRYYDSAYAIRSSLKSKKGLANSYYEFGKLYFTMQNQSKSRGYILKSIALANEINASDVLLKCYDLLRNSYRKTAEYKDALRYDDLYIELNNKILGEEKQKVITQMQVKYETEKKQNEIVQLNNDRERQATRIRIDELELAAKNDQLIALIGGLVLLFIIAIAIFIRYKDRQRFARKIGFLIGEIHHRIKNNLQVLSSVFSLQNEHIDNEKAKSIMQSNIQRIDAMKLIHQNLYMGNDIAEVNANEYINNLVRQLLAANQLETKCSMVIDVDTDRFFEADKAIIVGLLINELVTNAFKYAFLPHNLHPELQVKLHYTADKYVLIIKDNGSMVNENSLKKSFGLRLVSNHVKLLKGELQHEFDGGLKYTITF